MLGHDYLLPIYKTNNGEEKAKIRCLLRNAAYGLRTGKKRYYRQYHGCQPIDSTLHLAMLKVSNLFAKF